MADVELKCEKCGRLIKVSQFAKVESVHCPDCGGTVKRQDPAKGTADKAGGGLAVKRKKRAPERIKESVDGSQPEDDSVFAQTMKSVPKSNRKEKRTTRHLYSWILFLVLVPIAYFCRYGYWIPDMQTFGEAYGGWVLIFFHVIVVLMAFKDDTFQGILTLLVPGYSLYYLFLVSDAFYMRAFISALLVAFGQDGGLQIGRVLYSWYDAVSVWIAKGGGDIR